MQAETRLLESVAGKIAELKELADNLMPKEASAEAVLPQEADQKLPNRSTLEPLQKIAQDIDDACRASSLVLTQVPHFPAINRRFCRFGVGKTLILLMWNPGFSM